MASEDFSQKFQGLKISDSKDINILLLGETGVGKSTFINAIANYLHFRTFKKASKADDLLILIPSVITVTNCTNEDFVTLTVGSDHNEFQEIGAAGTQDVKTYVFPIGGGKTRLRLIDSPGMGDPRGIEQDDVNCENILAYLSQIKELHAVCFLMRPTTTRKTILFEYCMKQILSRLEKSATNNIIFVFTNTRGNDYSPGDTLPILKTIVEEIKGKPPHAVIPLQKNIFSLDNEAFRFLIAMKKGIKFKDAVQERFIESWNNSAKQCWSLISYIVGDAAHDGLKPHQLSSTLSINEARKIIVQLSRPMADISQLISDNLRILDRHVANLKMENQSLDELKRKLFIPIINLQVTQLTQPVTVCTSPKCADVVKVGTVQKWHYRQRCHDPCYLKNVTKEIVGDMNLMGCAAMGGRTCLKCTCDFSVHMHVYYLTKTVDDKIEDQIVKQNITRKEEVMRESERLIGQIEKRKSELEAEQFMIIKSTAHFAHFLQHNAISPFNDSYKAYIEYLITREKSLGRNGDPEVIHNLEQLLRQYEEMKNAFESSLKLEQYNPSNTVTAQNVMATIEQLYRLKHNGGKIKELLNKQETSRRFEYDKNCEYIHPKSSDLSFSSDTKGKVKKDKKKCSQTDDEAKKKKDKPKRDGAATDDERRQRTVSQNRTFNPPQRPHYQRPQHQFQHWREPPPPYESDGSNTQNRQFRRREFTNQKHEGEPNLVVKVELNQPGKNQRNLNSSNRQGYQNPPLSPYYGGPQQPYYGPGSHYGPPPPPPSGNYGPPQGQYGPPPGQYYGPPYYGPPTPGQYYGPPQGHYQGHEPPQGQYQRRYAGPQNQGNRGQYPKNKGAGRKRGKSKTRSPNGGKSGKSSTSSDSDSS